MIALERLIGIRVESQRNLRRDLRTAIAKLLDSATPIPNGNRKERERSFYLPASIVQEWRERPRIGPYDRMDPDEFKKASDTVPFSSRHELVYSCPSFSGAVLVLHSVEGPFSKNHSATVHVFSEPKKGLHQTLTYELSLGFRGVGLRYSGTLHRASDSSSSDIAGGVIKNRDSDILAFSGFLSQT